MLWEDRIQNYVRETKLPRSMFVMEDGRVAGFWVMGNDYRVRSGYYGGYPNGYLKRIRALFPEKRTALHLFSGRADITIFPGDTVDSNASLEPTFVDDASTLENVPLECYDIVLADPPYSVEDCDHYGTPMVKRGLVMKALSRLTPGAHLVWLDQASPMYRKDVFDPEARIGIERSTNHRFRSVKIFRRLAPGTGTK